MTVVPNPSGFVNSGRTPAPAGGFTRPNLTERFWGYEVRPNEQVISIAVLMRLACGLAALGSGLAAVGIWLVPVMAFVVQASLSKASVSIVLACLAVVLARIAARGTQVRVQIDTSNGEVREVVNGPLGATVVLARYGFDSVEAIELATSLANPALGQIRLDIKGGGAVPVGDGALVALHALRDRLASDCGLDARSRPRQAIWAGPIAA